MARLVLKPGLDEEIARRVGVPAVQRALTALEDAAQRNAPPVRVWLCVLPDTPVRATGVTHAARRHYVGPVVRVTTESGRTVTLTPEHPVLTGNGWVEAQLLHESDDLIQVVAAEPARTPEVERRPPRIGKIIDAAMQTLPVQVWPVGVPMDLDGEGVDGDIEVVAADGDLASRFQSSVGECLDDDVFVGTHLLAEVAFLALGDAGLSRRIKGAPNVGCGSGGHRGAPLAVGESARSEQTCGAHVSHGNATLNENATDGRLRAAVDDTQGPLGGSGEIAADQVVSVDVIAYSGHVYDLSTVSHWYLADGLIVHNSARDERVRASHMLADTQTIPDNLRFRLERGSGQFDLARNPRDPTLPIDQRAGCRCDDPTLPGPLRDSIHKTDVHQNGTLVEGAVETRFPRAIESEVGTSEDEAARFMRNALREVAALLKSGSAR